MRAALKHSQQVGNDARLCLDCDKSQLQIYNSFLKADSTNSTNTVFMYLQQGNAQRFEQEMKRDVQKLKLAEVNDCDCGHIMILVAVSMIALWKFFP